MRAIDEREGIAMRDAIQQDYASRGYTLQDVMTVNRIVKDNTEFRPWGITFLIIFGLALLGMCGMRSEGKDVPLIVILFMLVLIAVLAFFTIKSFMHPKVKTNIRTINGEIIYIYTYSTYDHTHHMSSTHRGTLIATNDKRLLQVFRELYSEQPGTKVQLIEDDAHNVQITGIAPIVKVRYNQWQATKYLTPGLLTSYSFAKVKLLSKDVNPNEALSWQFLVLLTYENGTQEVAHLQYSGNFQWDIGEEGNIALTTKHWGIRSKT